MPPNTEGGVTTAQNIYESIGEKAEMLTLSNGKYEEFIPNKTIVRIGTVLLNTQTHEIVDFVSPNDTAREEFYSDTYYFWRLRRA